MYALVGGNRLIYAATDAQNTFHRAPRNIIKPTRARAHGAFDRLINAPRALSDTPVEALKNRAFETSTGGQRPR